jgi:DNA-binding transcriptional LysR family regulator
VSRLISDLESEVGFQLFARLGRNLKATPEALLLVEEVRRALSGLEQIKHTATSIKHFRHAQLRLISTPAFSILIAPALIRKFAERQSEAMVSLEVQSIDVAVEWMASQNIDFGIA